MITITTLHGKYYFTDFIYLNSGETSTINETLLTENQILNVLGAKAAERITISTQDLEKLELALKKSSSTVDLSDYALQSSVDLLQTSKEDKEEGKGLSSNDFTNTLKSEVENIDSKINAAVAALVNNAPASFDTLKEIADWIEAEGIKSTDLLLQLSRKVNTTDVISIANGGTGSTTVATAKEALGLNNVSNIPDASKSVASAGKLATARTISFTGGATGTFNFDGSANASVNLTVDLATCLKTDDSRIVNWNTAATNSHTHTNKAILDATTASYTVADKTKLDGLSSVVVNQLTQTQYDALTTDQKNLNNVFYVIVG